ncbi:hypothetical protein ACX8Z9_06135 [Arthrobacter halodurans]|uniref:Uncharacterized protein n=1 Tax=Arthrobacter halodurans TaxID=516699 RepID=A0ABV4UQQ6_9MICC
MAGTVLVAGLVCWSYGLAMVTLAALGLVGLGAAITLPANLVPAKDAASI